MDPLTIASAGMQSDLQRMATISQNLANVTTAGYKRQIPVVKSFSSYLNEAAIANDPDMSASALSPAQTVLDMSAGTLRRTGNSLDFAIDGEGFFEVQSEQGPVYTRQGQAHVDARGRLVDAHDYPIMGLTGDLIANGNGPITINAQAEVKQGERLIGQLKVALFSDPNQLIALGNGLFAQGGAQWSDKKLPGTVRSGYQENSNVNSAQEMVRLTETMRHFEAMQKVIQGYDDLYEKAMRKLGDF